MYKLYRYLCSLAVITIFISSCTTQFDQTDRPIPEPAHYNDLLGKSLNDDEILSLIDTYHCTPETGLQICKGAGMALWLGPKQIVNRIVLYLYNDDGYVPYTGELPFGLKFYDTLEAVEFKLERQGLDSDGLPDETGTPDHTHYWAIYSQLDMIIIYNSYFADEAATIYAIVVTV